ncbi:hypothetical protein [Candidatus Phytoplasma solani]|uniref:hypothetical protein n=1 Tax=Candidatus Phytoplasma solani TaxID=69896 RepID=UPI00358DFA8D
MVSFFGPVGIKRTFPAVGQQLITNIKDTSLFQIIGLSSLFLTAQSNITKDPDIWIPYIIVCSIYLIIIFISNFIFKLLQKK